MDGLPGDWRVVEPPAPAPPNTPGSKPPAIESNRVWAIVLAVGLAGLVGAGAWMLAGPTDATVGLEIAALEEALESPAETTRTPVPLPDLIVDVGGAVQRPGVYRLADGSRIVDAIEAAGGFGPSVDAAAAARDLNLAAALRDGDRVRVPVRGGTAGSSAGGASGGAVSTDGPASGDGLVDLNTASSSELEALPAIGPATAAKIIAARDEAPFESVEELRSRRILGEAALAKVRDLVTVR